jgi:Protein SCAI
MPAYVPGSKGYIENGDNRRSMRDNPHKYLLYKPSLSQLMVFLSSGFKELPPGGALLLYISADGCFSTTKHPQDCKSLSLSFVFSFAEFLSHRWLRAGWFSNERETGWNRKRSVHTWEVGGESQRAALLVPGRSLSVHATSLVHHHRLR